MRNKSLDNMRFFMAVTIFLAHVTKVDIFRNAIIGVKFFFMLSGFGLTLSNKDCDVTSLRDSYIYAFGKMKKIYKWYILIITLTLPIQFINLQEWHDTTFAVLGTILTIIVTPTLLQSIAGIAQLSHLGEDGFWFISCLFILYMVYPYIKRLNDRIVNKCTNVKSVLVILIVVVLFESLFYRFFVIVQRYVPLNDLSYGSPYINVFAFVEGILVADIYKYLKDEINNSNLYEIVAIILLVFWWIGGNAVFDDEPFMILNSIVAVMVLFAFSFQKGIISKIINNKFLSLSWSATYIYLTHSLVLRWIRICVDDYVKYISFTTLITGLLSYTLFVIDKKNGLSNDNINTITRK